MKWLIKEKKTTDYIRKRFALLPTKVNEYWVWLETYFYYCYPPCYVDESRGKNKFINYYDCLAHLKEDIANDIQVC